MTTFYFVRHGQMDTSMAGKKFYKDFSYNMMTLSEKGIDQIKETAKDVRLASWAFFSWMEEEDYIIKSPMKRIHKVKTAIIVKDTIPDEKVEILRDNCNNLRDKAMIDFKLY